MTELQIVQRVFPKWRSAELANLILWEGTAYPMAGLEGTLQQLREFYGRGCRAGWRRRVWRKFAKKQREWNAEL